MIGFIAAAVLAWPAAAARQEPPPPPRRDRGTDADVVTRRPQAGVQLPAAGRLRRGTTRAPRGKRGSRAGASLPLGLLSGLARLGGDALAEVPVLRVERLAGVLG